MLAIWTLCLSIYRQGFGVAFFIWIFIPWLGYDLRGVWFGIAVAVVTVYRRTVSPERKVNTKICIERSSEKFKAGNEEVTSYL